MRQQKKQQKQQKKQSDRISGETGFGRFFPLMSLGLRPESWQASWIMAFARAPDMGWGSVPREK